MNTEEEIAYLKDELKRLEDLFDKLLYAFNYHIHLQEEKPTTTFRFDSTQIQIKEVSNE